MYGKSIYLGILPLLCTIHLFSQDIELINHKMGILVNNSELASLDYQYYPQGPILELKNEHFLGTIRLTSGLNVEFRTGYSDQSEVRIDNTGYTQLGYDAPAIKIKELNGTSASTNNGGKQFPHGLSDDQRILGVIVHMRFGTQTNNGDVNGFWYPPGSPFADQNYTYFYDQWNVTVQNSADSGTTLQNKPVRILVFYTQ